MKPDVTICEMAPRDGLQMLNRSASIPLEDRVALVAALQRAHLQYIEAGAFVSPRRVPAMADSADLFARLSPYAGELAALVPNLAHFERCAAAPNVDTVALFVSASPWYALANTRMTVEEALSAAAEVAVAAVARGYRVRAHVSGAFRDLTDANGETAAADTAQVCARLRQTHTATVIVLADTDGRATEADVQRVISRVDGAMGLDGIGVHLHDRDGNGLAKARAAYALGVRVFDAAAGGIGGNPTVLADAAGNVATEALVRMLEAQGARTGIDWEALIDAGAIVARMAERVGDPPPPSAVLAAALDERNSS